MDVDVLERNFSHEFEAHHHHPGNPEEDDVERGDKRRRREEGVEVRRLVRPSLCGERPKRGGEPGVEDVFVLNKFLVRTCFSLRLRFAQGDIRIAVFVVPCRNPVPPPELPGDTPGLDVFHPVEIGLFPVFRDEFGLAVLYRRNGRLSHCLCVDIPLIRHPRLNDDIGAVAERLFDLEVLDLLKEFCGLECLNNFLARLKPLKAAILGWNASFVRLSAIHDMRGGVQNVQWRVARPLADFEIVEVMRRGNLHRTGALVRVGIFIGNDRYTAPDNGQLDKFADQARIARIFRMHRNAGIAQHGFRA